MNNQIFNALMKVAAAGFFCYMIVKYGDTPVSEVQFKYIVASLGCIALFDSKKSE